MTYHRVCNHINMTGSTSGAGTVYPSGAPEFNPGYSGFRFARSLVCFMCMFCRSLFFLLYIFRLAIVLSVPLRITDSGIPFGIFKLFLI
jgi:hypothetical protein